MYDGKVNTMAIDKRKIKCCYRDNDKQVYAAMLYCVQLKQKVLAAFVYYRDKDKPEIIIGTDTQMEAMTLCRYYGLRFQVVPIAIGINKRCQTICRVRRLPGKGRAKAAYPF